MRCQDGGHRVTVPVHGHQDVPPGTLVRATLQSDAALVEGRFGKAAGPVGGNTESELLSTGALMVSMTNATAGLRARPLPAGAITPLPFSETDVEVAAATIAVCGAACAEVGPAVSAAWATVSGYVAGLLGSGTAGKLAKLAEQLAQEATQNPESNTVVLGKYNASPSYIAVAKALGNATYFNLENWSTVTAKVPGWLINEAVLQQQMGQGKTFVLASDPESATGAFGQEVEFLVNAGYHFVSTGEYWQAVK